ncbi:MAG: EamA family transporter [Candidatus Dormibacteraeota bacterium]|nr:EamA family transporter [Candidatus Dormibacteraeota bacterium]MBV8445128.1 EamA family transporter [Candidatus Dormibacteraeota bacterium]
MGSSVQPSRPAALRVVVAFALVYVIWGSTYLTIHLSIESMPPFLMAAARFVLAGLLVLAWQLRPGRPGRERLTWQQWRSAAIIGACLLLGGNGIVTWGEQYVGTGYMSLIVATVPLWMALFAPLYGGRRVGPLAATGVAVGLAGTGLLLHPSGAFHWQSVAVIASPLLWANGSLYAQRAALPRSALTATGMEMVAGGLLLGVASAAGGELGHVHLGAVTLTSWLAFGYLIVFGSLVGYTAYVWLLSNVSITAVSTYAYVNPLVAVLLGALFLGEQITGITLIAGALIIVAVAAILTSRGRAAQQRRYRTQPQVTKVA